MSVGQMVPLLLVAGLGWYIYGRGLFPEEEAAFLSGLQETLLPLILIIPATLVVIVLFINEVTVIPLVLLLAVYLGKVALVGPLLLVFMIRFLDRFRQSFKRPLFLDQVQSTWRDGQGGFLGFIVFASLVFFLNTLFCEGSGCVWISMSLALSTFIFFSLY